METPESEATPFLPLACPCEHRPHRACGNNNRTAAVSWAPTLCQVLGAFDSLCCFQSARGGLGKGVRCNSGVPQT